MNNQEYIENYEIGLENLKAEKIEDRLYGTVESLIGAIRESKDPEAVIAAFDRDPNFHNAFNSNGLPALENLEAYLEASTETMIGDAMRRMKAQFSTLKKLRDKIAEKNIDEKCLQRRAIGLPNASDFDRILNNINKVCDLVRKIKPEDTADDIKSKLQSLGIKPPKIGTIIDFDESGDAKACIASIIIGIFAVVSSNTAIDAVVEAATSKAITAGTLATASAASLGVAVLTILGAAICQYVVTALLHKNGKPVGQRGWTENNIKSSIDKMLKCIDKNSDISMPDTQEKQLVKRIIESINLSIRLLTESFSEVVK